MSVMKIKQPLYKRFMSFVMCGVSLLVQSFVFVPAAAISPINAQNLVESNMSESTLCQEPRSWGFESLQKLIRFEASFLPSPVNAPASGARTARQIMPQAIPELDCNTDSLIAERIVAAGLFTLPIIQQPAGRGEFVSTRMDMVTQYRQPGEEGVTGLLAHNYLSGQQFYQLEIGQELQVMYTNNQSQRYRITRIEKYRKIDANSLSSDLVDLSTERRMTSGQVYDQVYTGRHHLTLQTCLEGNGRLNYGLTFIIAEPIN
jgi:hypothetical protein